MRSAADILREELVTRKSRNPSYSLRAFSRDLDVSPATLSQFLNGKRMPSRKSLIAITSKLAYSPLELGLKVGDAKGAWSKQEILRDDEFKLISDWSYFAVMNLAKLKTCKSDPKWIGKALNLSPDQVRVVIDRLLRLGYVKIEGRRLIRTKAHLRTTFDIPSEAIRSNHRQNLENAARALVEVETHLREFIALTLDISSSRIPVAKELIRKFISEMSGSLQDGPSDQVYTMAIQLFPLSRLQQGEKS